MQHVDNIYILIILAMVGSFLMVSSFILLYVRNQNKILKQRQQLQFKEIEHQKELLQAIIESQETERKRIGQDLHDDVGTALSSLRLTIEMFNPVGEEDNNNKHVKLSKEIIDKVIRDVRYISHNLSPPALSYYGLAAAIEEKTSFINNSGQLTITLINDAEEVLKDISLPVSVALYRVLEELINNTIKHAGATQSIIKIAPTDNALLVTYSDNGKGMDASSITVGMGMQNIESRLTVINADYVIDTAAGQGFGVSINYPLPAN
jgi:signal transduction histidine kinase